MVPLFPSSSRSAWKSDYQTIEISKIQLVAYSSPPREVPEKSDYQTKLVKSKIGRLFLSSSQGAWKSGY